MPLIYAVDDCPSTLSWYRYALRLIANVKTFTSGADLLENVTASRPDLIITDIMMPGISGIEVVRAARNLAPDVPIIMASVLCEQDFRPLAERYGCTWWGKSADSESLLHAIKELAHVA